MTIEHIFFDLDGTLIGGRGGVADSVWAAIEPLRGRIGMSVCTGRPRAGVAQRVAEKLDHEGLHIFENGGLIAPANGDAAQVYSLDVPELMTLATAAKQIDATLEFYTPHGVFVSRLDDDCIEHGRAIDIHPEEADLSEVAGDREVTRAHWIMREHALADVLAVPLVASEIGVASSPVLPGMIFASITRRGVSKGTSAAELARHAGVNLKDCVAIGDAEGDLPILEAVGHPYVMRNSPASLRDRFEVLGDVDEEGVEPLLARLR